MLGRLLAKIPHTTIHIDGQPYLTRYFLTGENERSIGERPNLFLHHFHMSDQGRELHNHPYTGTSLILRGGYIEERISVLGEARWYHEKAPGSLAFDPQFNTPAFGSMTAKVHRPGDINRIGLQDFHRTELLDRRRGAWTLFFTGPRVKSWGFINRNTLEFFPYESQEATRLGRGPHMRDAQFEAMKGLEHEVTHVLHSHLANETPGRIAHALRLRNKETS